MVADLLKREGLITETSRNEDGTYQAVIAVNDDVGDGRPIDLRAMDLHSAYLGKNPTVLYAHNAWSQLPVARTTALRWEPRGLVADFEFLQRDSFAARVENAWSQGFLRAASITARPTDNGGTELIEWSIVPVPADADAVRSAYSSAIDHFMGHAIPPTTRQPSPPSPTEQDMNEIEVAAIVNRVFDEREAKARAGDELKTLVREALAEAGIDLAGETAAAAATPTDGTAKPPGDSASTTAAPTEGAEETALTPEQQAEQLAEVRTAALELTRGLLPEGFDPAGKSVKDLYVAAVGTEVEDAANRSEGYLQAKLEEIKARRDGARGASPTASIYGSTIGQTPAAMPLSRSMNAVDIQRLGKKGAVA